MKAILEFNYPEDEAKLRRVMNADKAFEALRAFDERVKYRWRKDDNLLDVLEFIREELDHVLEEAGEK